MFCGKCENHLSKCTCKDLQERLDKLKQCEHLFIAPEVMAAYEAQAQRNKAEHSETE